MTLFPYTTLFRSMFAWLMLSDRLNTRDMLQRRHWNVTEEFHCVLCPTRAHEDRDHLFFTCAFSQRIWNYLQIEWQQGDDLYSIVKAARRGFAKPFFSEVVMIACWNLWLVRNDKIFNHIRPRFAVWRSKVIHDFRLLVYRMKAKYRESFVQWINSLV